MTACCWKQKAEADGQDMVEAIDNLRADLQAECHIGCKQPIVDFAWLVSRSIYTTTFFESCQVLLRSGLGLLLQSNNYMHNLDCHNTDRYLQVLQYMEGSLGLAIRRIELVVQNCGLPTVLLQGPSGRIGDQQVYPGSHKNQAGHIQSQKGAVRKF